MKTIKLLLSLGLLASVAAAGVVEKYSWSALQKDGRLLGGKVVTRPDGPFTDCVRIENRKSEPVTVKVLVIDKPAITSATYAITGDVRHENVEGKAFLEMWNHFPAGRYFSRTFADTGPMKHLQGTSAWRPFSLAFFNKPGEPMPVKLELNVVLPGKGTVVLGPVRLVEYAQRQAGGWWDNRTGGLVGGAAGGLLGILGAAVGILGSRDKTRKFALGLTRVVMVLGNALLLVGIYALLVRQPYAVCYPLLLLGLIGSLVFMGVRKTIQRQIAQAELRKMQAMDSR